LFSEIKTIKITQTDPSSL